MLKTVLALTFGALLLVAGLIAVPRFMNRVVGREEDPGVLIGRAIVLAAEFLIGAWLIYVGIRAFQRSNKQ